MASLYSQRIAEHYRERAALLAKMRRVEAATAQAASLHLLEILREAYRLHKAYFDSSLVEAIRQANSDDPTQRVYLDDEWFVVGHWYFAPKGFFTVFEIAPSLKFGRPGAAQFCSKDLADTLWSGHLRELGTVKNAICRYVSREVSAETELGELRKQMEDELEAAHSEFLRGRGFPATGLTRATRGRRITHCYSCAETIDSAFDLECLACHWIVCDCGACGCGYSKS